MTADNPKTMSLLEGFLWARRCHHLRRDWEAGRLSQRAAEALSPKLRAEVADVTILGYEDLADEEFTRPGFVAIERAWRDTRSLCTLFRRMKTAPHRLGGDDPTVVRRGLFQSQRAFELRQGLEAAEAANALFRNLGLERD
ncbi:MAG: hypothetical protein ACRCT8_02610 [Lacipirellulaceae bacterium]